MLRNDPFYYGILWHADLSECIVDVASTYAGVSCIFGLRCIRSELHCRMVKILGVLLVLASWLNVGLGPDGDFCEKIKFREL